MIITERVLAWLLSTIELLPLVLLIISFRSRNELVRDWSLTENLVAVRLIHMYLLLFLVVFVLLLVFLLILLAALARR